MTRHQDKDFLVDQYVEKGKSTYEIADEVGVSASTIYHWLKKNDIDRRDRSKAIRLRQGVNRANYYTDPKGYETWKTSIGDGEEATVIVSRLAAVAWHGLDAVVGNEVHHKNGVPWDNREENLEPLTTKDHMNHHARENYSDSDGNEQNFAGSPDLDWITPEMIKKHYHEKGMSQQEVANELEVSRGVIRNRMDWWDIESREKFDGLREKYK